MYTTFPSVSSIMCTDSQLGRELRAYIYWIEPLWRVLKVPLEQTCPLFENHCFRLRNKYSVSKISMRKQSLWSITEAMGRTLSLTFSPPPPLFFPALSFGPSLNSEDSERGFGWVGLERRLSLINSELQGTQPRQTPLPQGPSSTGRWKHFSHRSPVFCSKVSLWNLSYTWRRSTGATDTVKFKAVFSQGYRARASSSV